MRIHICVTVFITLFSYFFEATQTEFLLVFLCIGFVISSEMVNTAIETLVNLKSPSYNSLARIAKDVAAGAVAVSAIVAIVVGGCIFLKPQKLICALTSIITNPIAVAIFLVVIILSILFIFNGKYLRNESSMKIYHMKNQEGKNK